MFSEALVKKIRVPLGLEGRVHIYVLTYGRNTNDGLQNTPARAFRILQGAINYGANNFNLDFYLVIIHLGPGVFDPFVMTKYAASTGSIMIRGDESGQNHAQRIFRGIRFGQLRRRPLSPH